MILQPAYKGIRKEGETKQVYHNNYKKKNPERIAHLKARRYTLHKGAEGSHSFEDWVLLKTIFNNCCAVCHKEVTLTKDHIIPLSKRRK